MPVRWAAPPPLPSATFSSKSVSAKTSEAESEDHLARPKEDKWQPSGTAPPVCDATFFLRTHGFNMLCARQDSGEHYCGPPGCQPVQRLHHQCWQNHSAPQQTSTTGSNLKRTMAIDSPSSFSLFALRSGTVTFSKIKLPITKKICTPASLELPARDCRGMVGPPCDRVFPPSRTALLLE